MKFKILFSCILLFSLNIHAQYSNAKADDYPDIKSRPLIVEMIELDKELIENWEKKKSKANTEEKAAKFQEKIDRYSAFAIDYNKLIKEAVENHWNINPEVIYMSTSEVKELRKKKSKDYTVLWYSDIDSKRKDGHGFTYFPHLTVPALNYSRIEKGSIITDYCYFLHYTHNREDKIEYSDFVLSFKLMKQHMDYIIKIDKKKFSFQKYVMDKAVENCSDFSGKTAYIQDEAVHKNSSITKINNNFSGEILTLTDEEISKAILEKEDRIIGFFFPFSIATSSFGGASVGRIQYIRSFVNTKTGEVYTTMGGKTGQLFDPYFRDKEFKKYNTCKL